MGLDSHPVRAVAIIAGGATPPGSDIALRLASWTWPVVIVYLDHQARAEATVAEIIGAGGSTVAVRADLADELDVQRMFAESVAAFGHVDVLIDTTAETAEPLYEQVATYLRKGGVMVTTSDADAMPRGLESGLGERGITLAHAQPEGVLGILDRWRQRNHT
jgi:NAD(P)-dependent dehydrogenase (short-subunit alcohol dehydrogenase family)